MGVERGLFRESLCESGEGARLPRERGGSPGNFRGSPGNFRGRLGNFQGTSGLLLSSTVRELPGKSPKNFQGSSGNFQGSPGNFPEARGSLTPSQRLAKFVSKFFPQKKRSFSWERHDNKILKMQFLLSRNLVVIAQAII